MTVVDGDVLARARRVRAIVLDVDGVLTDGVIGFDRHGDAFRSFFVRDGSALKLAMSEGIRIALLSGRTSESVARRAAELGIEECVQGHRVKVPAWIELLARLGIPESDVAYMGDDYLDLPLLARAGLAAAPSDSAPEALAAAHWIAGHAGGRGAVRDLVELVMRAQGSWERAIQRATTVGVEWSS